MHNSELVYKQCEQILSIIWQIKMWYTLNNPEVIFFFSLTKTHRTGEF